jgi:hypothetical protein
MGKKAAQQQETRAVGPLGDAHVSLAAKGSRLIFIR